MEDKSDNVYDKIIALLNDYHNSRAAKDDHDKDNGDMDILNNSVKITNECDNSGSDNNDPNSGEDEMNNRDNDNNAIPKPENRWIRSTIIPYFRELSIVIIGVLVTLSITNWINNSGRQREISGILTQIKEELQQNLKTLEWDKSRWEGEQRMFLILQHYKNEPDKIPVDTFTKYDYSAGAVYHPAFVDDSYELLKSSQYIQYIKDKELLRKISGSYRELRSLSSQLSNYSAQKISIFLNPMMEKMNSDNAWILSNGDPSKFFIYLLREEGFNKFLHVGRTILSPSSIFEDNKNNLQETILKMESAGY